MFIDFFYLLRARGLGTDTTEWMTLMEALMKGLHGNSLSGFYNLCRATLVKTEADYDKFDMVFAEFFKDVPFTDELPAMVYEWLSNKEEALKDFHAFLKTQDYKWKSQEEILEMFEQRLKEQREEHNGGSYWIGTGGFTNFGHSGHAPEGIRISGQGRYRRAFEVLGERRFRDFRKDNVLDIRSFQMAFRLLRQYSDRVNEAETEFDTDGTIRETADHAGNLKIKYKKPRRNIVKVLLLMDSGGSMDYYSGICSMLFQAAEKSNHFKELQVYYFHNCIGSTLYKQPQLFYEDGVSTEWVLNQYGSEYKVILVGDALMDMYDLVAKHYDRTLGEARYSGFDMLERFREQYPHIVWLNPETPPYGAYKSEDPEKAWSLGPNGAILPKYLATGGTRGRGLDDAGFGWGGGYGGNWGESYGRIADIIPMYPLTVSGLEHAMKKLLVSK